MYRPIIDDDGKTVNGLFDCSSPSNDFDTLDKHVYWESRMDMFEETFSGEALVNHERQQRDFNNSAAAFDI